MYLVLTVRKLWRRPLNVEFSTQAFNYALTKHKSSLAHRDIWQWKFTIFTSTTGYSRCANCTNFTFCFSSLSTLHSTRLASLLSSAVNTNPHNTTLTLCQAHGSFICAEGINYVEWCQNRRLTNLYIHIQLMAVICQPHQLNMIVLILSPIKHTIWI